MQQGIVRERNTPDYLPSESNPINLEKDEDNRSFYQNSHTVFCSEVQRDLKLYDVL